MLLESYLKKRCLHKVQEVEKPKRNFLKKMLTLKFQSVVVKTTTDRNFKVNGLILIYQKMIKHLQLELPLMLSQVGSCERYARG